MLEINTISTLNNREIKMNYYDKNFKMKFPLSVSTTSYNGKCKDWGKVTYRTVEVDIDSLAEYVKQGFCFTHIFKDTVNKEFGTRQKPYQISIRHIPYS